MFLISLPVMCRINRAVQERTTHLVSKLVDYANKSTSKEFISDESLSDELISGLDLQVRWLDCKYPLCCSINVEQVGAYNSNDCPINVHRLLVKTDLVALSKLVGDAKTYQIRYVLKVLKDCLHIRDDLRFHQQESNWMFLLMLESPSKNRNDIIKVLQDKLRYSARYCQGSES